MSDERLQPEFSPGHQDHQGSRMKSRINISQGRAIATNNSFIALFLFVIGAALALLVRLHALVAKRLTASACRSTGTSSLRIITATARTVAVALRIAFYVGIVILKATLRITTVAAHVTVATLRMIALVIQYAQPITTSMRITAFAIKYARRMTMMCIILCMFLRHFEEPIVGAVPSRGGITNALSSALWPTPVHR